VSDSASIQATVSALPVDVTYTSLPFGEIAIRLGFEPAGREIVAVMSLVAVSIALTTPVFELAT
jgi:hypothetical protein